LQLESILSAASNAWIDAVASAKDQQQQVKDDIRQALAEMMEIKELLGADDPAAEAELVRLQVGSILGFNHVQASQFNR